MIPLWQNLAGLMLFARIIQQGSLSATARSLGLSRSAVSKQLTSFEEALGARLIQRTTRKLALTELGEQILHEAKRIEAALQSIESITDDFRETIHGKLKVSCSTAFGRVVLLPLLKTFAQHYPHVELELGLEDRFVDLVAEQVDVALRIGYLPDSSLIARRLGELRWQICASPAYLAEHGTPQTPADLTQHACLFYRNAQQIMNTWEFVNPNGPLRVKVRGPLAINDACALVDAAIAGMGIVLTDQALQAQAIANGQLIPLLQDYPTTAGFPVYAIYPARTHLPAKTLAFVDFLVEALAPQLN